MMISGLFNVGLITRYVYLWAIWIQRFHHVSFHKFWHAINVKAMNWSTSDNVHGRAVLCEVLNQTKHQLCRGSNFNWTTDARPEVKYELVTEAGTRSLDSRLLSYLLSMAKMVIFDNDDKRDREDEKLLRFCDLGADHPSSWVKECSKVDDLDPHAISFPLLTKSMMSWKSEPLQ